MIGSSRILPSVFCRRYPNLSLIHIYYGHSVSVSLGVVSREDGNTEIAWGGRSAQSLDAIDTEALAQEVAELGAQRLHAKPIASGKYAVILKNDAAAELLEAYLPIFYATEMQNEMSSLAGKEGEMIAISDINLVEDPQFAQGRVCLLYTSRCV